MQAAQSIRDLLAKEKAAITDQLEEREGLIEI